VKLLVKRRAVIRGCRHRGLCRSRCRCRGRLWPQAQRPSCLWLSSPRNSARPRDLHLGLLCFASSARRPLLPCLFRVAFAHRSSAAAAHFAARPNVTTPGSAEHRADRLHRSSSLLQKTPAVQSRDRPSSHNGLLERPSLSPRPQPCPLTSLYNIRDTPGPVSST